MEIQKLDIVKLIEKNPLIKLSQNYQSKLLTKIQQNFNDTEQRLFVASFYCYLNHNSKTDFVIELESIWKWLGYSRKEHCKVVLEKHFIIDIDYKIGFTEVAGKLKNGINVGGRPKEKILMTINTFKKLCLKSCTKKADEIHDYFIKLEETLQETINEESTELRNQLEQKEQLLIEQKDTIFKQRDALHRIQKRKLEKYQKREYLYIGSDNQNRCVIGISKDINERRSHYNTHNPDLEIKYVIPCRDYILTEKIVKKIMEKYTITNSKEWFECDYEKLKIIIEVVIYILDDTVHDYDKFEDIYKQFSNIHNQIFTEKNIVKIDKEKEQKLNETIDAIKIEKQKNLVNNYFTQDIYKKFITENCEINESYKESGKMLLLEFKNSLQNTDYKDKINQLFHDTGYNNSFGFDQKFKKEFYDNVEIILDTHLTDFRLNNKIQAGFRTIRIKKINNQNQEKSIYFSLNDYNKFFEEYIEFVPGKKRGKLTPKIKTLDIISHFIKYITKNNIKISDVNKDIIENLIHNQDFRKYFVSKIVQKYNIVQSKRLSFDNTDNRHYGFYNIKLIQF
jgi:hypothetical protein